MAEATKSVVKQGVVGDLRYVVYDLTNLANGETITTNLNVIHSVSGINMTTADKPFGASVAVTNGVGVLTAIVSTTTDEYRITIWGK